MFVRISRSKVKPERLEEFKAVFAESGLATARKQKGFRWAFALPPRDPATEQWVTISGWDSCEDAEAYDRHPDRIKTVGQWDDFYIEAPKGDGYDDVIE